MIICPDIHDAQGIYIYVYIHEFFLVQQNVLCIVTNRVVHSEILARNKEMDVFLFRESRFRKCRK